LTIALRNGYGNVLSGSVANGVIEYERLR